MKSKTQRSQLVSQAKEEEEALQCREPPISFTACINETIQYLDIRSKS
jgi:hypothetical protein